MTFKVLGLSKNLYQSCFDMTDEELREMNAIRSQVLEPNSTPCRVSLTDAMPGETVLLINHSHLDKQSPYDSKFAIFIRENAAEASLPTNVVPDYLYSRLLSVRAYSGEHHLQIADVVNGENLSAIFEGFFEEQSIEYLHVHNAREGCYLAKVVRD